MNTSSEMSLGAASCSIAASISPTPSLESPNNNHDPVKLRMDGDDPYIGFENFSCCKGFEFEGLLCQHAIKVLHHVGMEHLPSRYILKRWCKEANANIKRSVGEQSMDVGQSESLQAFRKATLHLEFKELEDLGSNSSAAFRIVRSRIGDIMNEVRLMVPNTSSTKQLELSVPIETITLEEEDKEDRDKEQTYLDPPLSQCKGRKKRPARFKPVIETTVRRRRTCSYCQTKEPHNIRTCPKRLEDLAKEKKNREEDEGIDEKSENLVD